MQFSFKSTHYQKPEIVEYDLSKFGIVLIHSQDINNTFDTHIINFEASIKTIQPIKEILDEAIQKIDKKKPTKIKIVAKKEVSVLIEEYFKSKKHNIYKTFQPNEETPIAYLETETGKILVGSYEKKIDSSLKESDEKTIKVMIVDDSKTIIQLLKNIIEKDPKLEVIASTTNPLLVEKMLETIHPDVITLDINMPQKDGITLLKEILSVKSIPIILISSVSIEESDTVLNGLEIGAVDYIQKPTFNEISGITPIILSKIKSAAKSKIFSNLNAAAGLDKKKENKKKVVNQNSQNHKTIIVIGASTGGTEALRIFLACLPPEIPPILIVQHIPEVFSKAFANRLNTLMPFTVKEAQDEDLVLDHQALIAPGGKQMVLKKTSMGLKVHVYQDDSLNPYKPSVDVLFESVTDIGQNAIGIILTGMGDDGAKGLLKMKQLGWSTIAQDESSCVVFGMPKAAIQLGGATYVEHLSKIASKSLSLLERKADNVSK